MDPFQWINSNFNVGNVFGAAFGGGWGPDAWTPAQIPMGGGGGAAPSISPNATFSLFQYDPGSGMDWLSKAFQPPAEPSAFDPSGRMPDFTKAFGEDSTMPSTTDAVKAAVTPNIGAFPIADGGKLPFPILGTMAGKSIWDVPTSGGSPGSREFGRSFNGAPIRGGRGHGGLDMPGAVGDPYVALHGGTILKTGFDKGGYGHYVDVMFDNGLVQRVGHLGDLDKGGSQVPFPNSLKPGARITEGAILGYVGYSGNGGREFPHAHVEMWENIDKYRASAGLTSRQGMQYRMDPRAYFEQVAAERAPETVKRSYAAVETPKPLAARAITAQGRMGLGIPPNATMPEGSIVREIKGKPTAYSPIRYGGVGTKKSMEGGVQSSRKGPDGTNLVRTVYDFLAGESDYITVAGNPKFYGKEYTIPELPVKLANGAVEVLKNVRAVVHDTGSAFKKAVEGRFDIALGHDLPNKEMALNSDLWKKWKGEGIKFVSAE